MTPEDKDARDKAANPFAVYFYYGQSKVFGQRFANSKSATVYARMLHPARKAKIEDESAC